MNEAGPVPVNNLANLLALLDILANAAEFFGIALGIFFLIAAIKVFNKRKRTAANYVGLAIVSTACGFATASAITWFSTFGQNPGCLS